MAANHLRFSPLSSPFPNRHLSPRNPRIILHVSNNGGGGSGGNNNNFTKTTSSSDDNTNNNNNSNPIKSFLSGWRSRVEADPQFPFKVLMEEVVGVSATAAGDMASRPNFGLSELDLVLSTLVVGSIVNFVLMYLLAPTATTSASPPSSLPSYIFEPGNFALASRIYTFLYKGVLFSAVGFASGLVGTGISNTLVRIKNGRGKEKGEGGPPMVMNAATWAVHMGVSSNLRYQTLNAVEFAMVRRMPAGVFKAAVLVLRGLNNVLGGVSFVALGKMMGSQKKKKEKEVLE